MKMLHRYTTLHVELRDRIGTSFTLEDYHQVGVVWLLAQGGGAWIVWVYAMFSVQLKCAWLLGTCMLHACTSVLLVLFALAGV
jgi:hypothetical protein